MRNFLIFISFSKFLIKLDFGKTHIMTPDIDILQQQQFISVFPCIYMVLTKTLISIYIYS